MYLKNAFKNLKHFIFRFIHFDITFTGPAYISFCLYGAISFDKKHGSMLVSHSNIAGRANTERAFYRLENGNDKLDSQNLEAHFLA